VVCCPLRTELVKKDDAEVVDGILLRLSRPTLIMCTYVCGRMWMVCGQRMGVGLFCTPAADRIDSKRLDRQSSDLIEFTIVVALLLPITHNTALAAARALPRQFTWGAREG